MCYIYQAGSAYLIPWEACGIHIVNKDVDHAPNQLREGVGYLTSSILTCPAANMRLDPPCALSAYSQERR